MSDESRAALLAMRPKRDRFASDEEYEEALGFWMGDQGRLLGASPVVSNPPAKRPPSLIVGHGAPWAKRWSQEDWDRYEDRQYVSWRRSLLCRLRFRLTAWAAVVLLVFPPYLTAPRYHFVLLGPMNASLDIARLTVELLILAVIYAVTGIVIERVKFKRPSDWLFNPLLH